MPLRAVVYLGSLKVAALVDTGSDYNAIGEDLSRVQSENKNASFMERRQTAAQSVSGCVADVSRTTRFDSSWEVTFRGTPVRRGKADERRVVVKFSEFAGLGDPIILGMPSIDALGGLELSGKFVRIVDLWIP